MKRALQLRRAAGAALLPWSLVHAQELPLHAVTSVEIVGAAPLAGLGVDRDTLPYNVQLLGRAQLGKARGDTIGETMARMLNGVNTNDVSGSPFQSDVTYRGFRASPVLGTAQGLSVYLDGVRVNEPFGDVVNWDLLPESAIDSVLLASGSNPVYGLNTIGGALAMTTRSGMTQRGTEVEVSATRAGRRRMDLSVGASDNERRHAFVAVSLLDDEGWRDYSPARIGKLFAKAGQKGGEASWEFNLLAAASRLHGNGLLPSYRWEDGRLRDGLVEADHRAAYTAPDQTRNRLLQGALNGARRLGDDVQLSVLAYLRHSRRDSVNGDINDDYADFLEACGLTCDPAVAPAAATLNTTATQMHGAGAAAQLSADLGAHNLQAGITIDRSRVGYAQFAQPGTFTPSRFVIADPTQPREPAASVDGSSSALGVYVADLWQVAASTHLSYSARWNRAVVGNTLTNDGEAQPRERFTYARLNPAIGLSHKIGALTFVANLAQGNRVPTVIELGCADPLRPCRLPVGLQADPYLRQVIARTAEAGLRWRVNAANVTAAAYRTTSADDILFFTAGQTRQGYFANFKRTLHQGLDVSADGRTGPVTLRINYSFLDATYDAAGELFAGARHVKVERGTRIAGLPRHTLKLGTQWEVTPALSLGADALASSSLVTQGNEDGLRADPDLEEAATADWRVRGYALVHLHARYRTASKWEWYARVDNLFDRRYANFGAVAPDMFPNGRLATSSPSVARFVAPGAPRSFAFGLRFNY